MPVLPFHQDRSRSVLQRVLFSIGVVVRLPCASESHLIVGERSTFLYRRSLSLGIGPVFRRLLCNLPDVNRMSVANWSYHLWSPKEHIGPETLKV